MTIDTTTIQAAIDTHGAKTVYAAANSRLAGSHNELKRVGLKAEDLGQTNMIAKIAYGQMSSVDQRADEASAESDLNRLAAQQP